MAGDLLDLFQATERNDAARWEREYEEACLREAAQERARRHRAMNLVQYECESGE